MTEHFELLVEEPSMEAFLRGLLPRLLPRRCTFWIHPFQGKQDLLKNLERRLLGYASWLPDNWRIVVVVDRDDDDCNVLKRNMEHIAKGAGLRTRSTACSSWQLVNRIVVEELESWYFGDWDAVRAAYPRVPAAIARRQPYRNPEAIAGGAWEAFERILKRGGYFRSGLPKIEVARAMGERLDPNRCRSTSFRCFCRALQEAASRTENCT